MTCADSASFVKSRKIQPLIARSIPSSRNSWGNNIQLGRAQSVNAPSSSRLSSQNLNLSNRFNHLINLSSLVIICTRWVFLSNERAFNLVECGKSRKLLSNYPRPGFFRGRFVRLFLSSFFFFFQWVTCGLYPHSWRHPWRSFSLSHCKWNGKSNTFFIPSSSMPFSKTWFALCKLFFLSIVPSPTWQSPTPIAFSATWTPWRKGGNRNRGRFNPPSVPMMTAFVNSSTARAPTPCPTRSTWTSSELCSTSRKNSKSSLRILRKSFALQPVLLLSIYL